MKNRFKRLGGRIWIRQFIAFDIETYISGPDKGRFLFGGCYDGEDYIYFTDRLKMKRFLCSSAFIGKIFVAHNTQYDINRIFLDDPDIMRFMSGPKMIFAKNQFPNGYTKKGKQRFNYIHYWDSFNYTARSLADMGDLIGMPKAKNYIGNKITTEQIEANRRDCEIVWHWMTGFQETLNRLGGNLRSTIAACAMDLFRREYMAEEAEFWEIPQGIIYDFRDAYYGGRVEVFDLNQFNQVFYYDINSSYGYAMTEEFPRLDTWVTKPNLDYEGCTYAEVNVPDMYYPPLPFRSHKVLFPTGKWHGFYYNNELRHAQACGAVVRPIRGYHYKKTYPVFRQFIETMQKEKEKSNDKFEYSIFKMIMNSLYGRFAMKGGLEMFQGDNREVIEMSKTSINVIWSGIIAARGRINLHDLIIKSGAIYCDTDSSMTETVQSTSKAMGGISLKKHFIKFRANNPKDYEFQEKGKPKRVIKGIPDHAYEIDKNHFQYEVPVKFKTARQQKIPLHKWIVIDKYVSTAYNKRIVEHDGNTRPFHIGV